MRRKDLAKKLQFGLKIKYFCENNIKNHVENIIFSTKQFCSKNILRKSYIKENFIIIH